MNFMKSLPVAVCLCAVGIPWLLVSSRRDTVQDVAGNNHAFWPGSEATALPEDNDVQEEVGHRRAGARNADGKTQTGSEDGKDGKHLSLLESTDEKSAAASERDRKEAVISETDSSKMAEKWGPTFHALGRNGRLGKVLLDDYVSFQAGSFKTKVQDKFRQLANDFASDGALDLSGFVQVKASEEKNERDLAKTIFQSFDEDNDGLITVHDLVQWTRKDATQHNVELDADQEKYFVDQYTSHADKSGRLTFESFSSTGLTKLVIDSYLEDLSESPQ